MKKVLTSIVLILAISIGAKSQTRTKPVFSDMKIIEIVKDTITFSFTVKNDNFEKSWSIQMASGLDSSNFRTFYVMKPDTLNKTGKYIMRLKLPAKGGK